MSTGPMHGFSSSSRTWTIAIGALLTIAGLLAMGAAFTATWATVFLFGILLLVAGVGQLFYAAQSQGSPSFSFHLLAGIVYTLVGAVLMFDPVRGAVGLTLLLALFLVIAGAFRVALSFQMVLPQIRTLLLVGGLLSIVLGVLIGAQWPWSGTWVIGLFVGIEMLIAGISTLLNAFEGGRMPSA